MPLHWHIEKSRVRPHFKSCSKLDIRHLRPNAMLTSLSLVFERLFWKYLKQLIHSQLCNQKHGFRIGRSTTTQDLQLNHNSTQNTCEAFNHHFASFFSRELSVLEVPNTLFRLYHFLYKGSLGRNL